MIQRPGMNEARTRCNSILLEKLAADELDEDQSTWLASHLDQCAACRVQLDLLNGMGNSWSERRTVLLSETLRITEPAAFTTDIQLEPIGRLPKREDAQSTSISQSLVRWLEPVSRDIAQTDKYIGSLDGFPIRRVLGVGGMGVVLDAWDPSLRRTIAIKAMHPHLAANGAARQRFVREARGAAAVLHPNVVAIHSVHAEHDPPYLIMPLIAGESLQARIDRVGPLEVDAALRIASQIADGLAAAHAQGLIHRDIKPGNILLEYGTERALLTDFGVVRALNDATMTASGVIAGTPEYMSPEQAGGKVLDTRSDLFSLGSVLYTMLAGHAPFRADSALAVLKRIEQDAARSLQEHRPDVPDSIEALVNWLQEKDSKQRIESAAELAQILRGLLAYRLAPQKTQLPELLQVRMQLQTKPARKSFGAIVCFSLLVLALFVVGRFVANNGTTSASKQSNLEQTTSTPSVLSPKSLREEAGSIDRELQRLEDWIDGLEKQLIRP